MSDLQPYRRPSLARRSLNREVRRVIQETNTAQLQVDGATYVGMHIMRKMVDVVDERNELARGNEFTGMLLDEIVSAIKRKNLHILSDLYSPWRRY